MARVLISMSKDFLKTLDDLATTENRTRSEMVRETVREYLKNNPDKLPETNEAVV